MFHSTHSIKKESKGKAYLEFADLGISDLGVADFGVAGRWGCRTRFAEDLRRSCLAEALLDLESDRWWRLFVFGQH